MALPSSAADAQEACEADEMDKENEGCMFLGFIPCADIRVNGNRLAHPEDVCGVDGCQDCEVCWWKGCPSMCKDIKVNGNPLDKPEHACGFTGCESCPICRSVSGA